MTKEKLKEVKFGNYKYVNFHWYRCFPEGMVLVSEEIEDVLNSCQSQIDRIREDSVRDFTEWVIDKRYSFGVDATVIGITIKQLDSWRDEYLKSKSGGIK